MKRLVFFSAWLIQLCGAAQSYPVKNFSADFIIKPISGYDISRNSPINIVKDQNDNYWFQSINAIWSYDGINWKSYNVGSPQSRNVPIRLNDVDELNGVVFLGTSEGLYMLDPVSDIFVPVNYKFPDIKNLPLAISHIIKGLPDIIILASVQSGGISLLNWKTKKVINVTIDESYDITLPRGYPLIVDRNNICWGITAERKGVWNYNYMTGKVLCSWKGDLPGFNSEHYKNVNNIAYSPADNSLFLTFGEKGFAEKHNLSNHQTTFISFSANLNFKKDSSAKGKYFIQKITVDKTNNIWVSVDRRFIIKLDYEMRNASFIQSDEDMFPVGKWKSFEAEEGESLIWINTANQLYAIKKRNERIDHISIQNHPDVQPADYDNASGRQTVFFLKGNSGKYFLLQQNHNRPKFIVFDSDLQIRQVLLNKKEARELPAYFNPEITGKDFYVALMRPGIEPLDFRKVVVKDIKVNLENFETSEVNLSFNERVKYYGQQDGNNNTWLFSNGFLFSLSPTGKLDSFFICKPWEKKGYPLEFVKGFDYPVQVHKKTNTCWIAFISTKELYKIDLVKKKIAAVYTCCNDRECYIPGGVFDIYGFDENSLCLQSVFSSSIIHPVNDSLTHLPDIFKGKVSVEQQMGIRMYGPWLIIAMPTSIYLLNTVTGKEKKLLLRDDFQWQITQLNSPLVVTDNGELILMSSIGNGFIRFQIDQVPDVAIPGIVKVSQVKLNNRRISIDSILNNSGLHLNFNKYQNLNFSFSDYSIFDQEKVVYEYSLFDGGDTLWNIIDGKPELNLGELSPGNYELLLRGSNGYGGYSGKITSFPIVIQPAFWQTSWFRLLVIAFIGFLFYCLYRYRLNQVRKLQLIRNNIASDLHDDIGSTLNSISIYSEVAKQQAGRNLPALDLIGINSRRVIESLGDIVWTINPENDSFDKIINRMRSFTYQLLKAKKLEFSFEADEKLNEVSLPMQVRKNFYLIFKEALTNLVKYAEASKVSVSLREDNKNVLLRILDNGKGITDNPDSAGNGLLNMKRRAVEINAILEIESAKNMGTAIELKLKIG